MKKVVSLILCLAVVFSLVTLPTASALSDVQGESEEKIGVLQMLGVISGYPDGTFKPAKQLTRAEFCKMAVILLGKGNEVDLYKNYTIFMDVKPSHWAIGYVNLATRAMKLLAGYPDGTFRPDAPIKYAEAVTILMRALNYQDADVGMTWPSSYLNKAAAIGLTSGISVAEPTSPTTRINGAALFYNMLLADRKDGSKFISTIAGTVEENAIILDHNAKAADGTMGAVLVEGKPNAIKTKNPMPASFAGLRGTLIYDEAGWIKAFLPSAYIKKSFLLAESIYPRLVSATGESYTLASDTPVYLDGKKETYLNVSYDLQPGTMIDVLYTAAGTVDYVIAGSPSTSANTAVLTSVPSRSRLESMFGATSGAMIYKNGAVSTVEDLKIYDVVSYNKAANVFTVTDFKLSGMYEYAYPNTSAPTKITILGTEFEVLSAAIEQLARFKIGDPITLLFTSDMRVIGAVSQQDARVSALGVYTGSAIELSNGIVLNVKQDDQTVKAGTLVKVHSSVTNYTSISKVIDNNPNFALNINRNVIGDKMVAGNAVFYEKVGAQGAVSRISKSDIALAEIPASRVFHVEYDSSGRASVIVLDDVTGDLYEYGKVYTASEETGYYPGLGSVMNNVAWVVNSKGESQHYIYGMGFGQDGFWGGIAPGQDNKVARAVELKKYTNLTRQSFGPDNTMVLSGYRTPISEEVHIYVNATGKYMTMSSGGSFSQLIADARAFGTSFEAYTDRDPAEGGKVRVLIIK